MVTDMFKLKQSVLRRVDLPGTWSLDALGGLAPEGGGLAGLLLSPLSAAAPLANRQIISSVPMTRMAAHFRVLVLEAMAVE